MIQRFENELIVIVSTISRVMRGEEFEKRTQGLESSADRTGDEKVAEKGVG